MQYNEITILDTAAAAGFFTTRNTTAKARRTALAEQAKTFGGTVAWPHLVHGTHIVQLTEEHLGKGLLELPDTDGCITDVPGIALTVTCGDCLPIYLFDPQHQAIGLAHAGWKGTLGGIAASLVAAMQKAYGTDPAQLIGRVGPGISPCCFQVRKDCYEQFTDKYYWSEEFLYRLPDGTHTLDLKGINLQLLQLCGVEDLQASTRCTCCEPESFYSYRRCGDQDRMLAYFYRKPQNGEPGFLPSLGVSRCLLGEPCRYDGLSKPDETVKRLGQHYYLVPVCPEQLGGLSTPRPASERRGAQVLMNTESGLLDVTRAYLRGAEAARDILFANGAFAAVLKSKSPSCGKGAVYDGSFTKTLIKGDGVAAELFENSGIGVIGSHETALLEGLFLTPQQRKTCKKALRKEVRAAERAMCLSEKQQADRAITEQILSMEEYRRARSVFAYVGTAKEIDTRALLCRILEDGKTLYLPLCTGDGIMQAKRVDDLAQLKPGAFGIPEPPAYLPSAALSDIDLTLIPCVSCSHDGKRLGQGGGFYDRFLARFQGDKVLLCREALTREDIPVEVHDIPIAVVVTDAGIVRS